MSEEYETTSPSIDSDSDVDVDADSDDSFPWGKTIIFLFIGVVVVGVAGYLIWRFYIKKKIEKPKKKTSESEESSKKAKTLPRSSTTTSRKSVRKVTPSRMPRKMLQKPKITKTDETTSSFAPPTIPTPSGQTSSAAQTAPNAPTAPTPSTSGVSSPKTSEEHNDCKHTTFAMYTYGNDTWKAKAKAPNDFTFSIESD